MKQTDTKPETSVANRGGAKPPRHYVKDLNADDPKAPFRPADEALCGYLWDRLNVEHNGEICEKCVEISRKMGRK